MGVHFFDLMKYALLLEKEFRLGTRGKLFRVGVSSRENPNSSVTDIISWLYRKSAARFYVITSTNITHSGVTARKTPKSDFYKQNARTCR